MLRYHNEARCGSCSGPLECTRDAVCETCVPESLFGANAMPQFGHLDRCMIEAEQTLWIAHETLCLIEHSGAFADRIHSLSKQIESLAVEMRSYNDQFEE